MNIAIDIDDTLTNSSDVISKYVHKYDSTYCNDGHLIDNIESIIRGFLIDEETKKFFNDFALEMGNLITIKDNAKEVIDKLRSEGNRIIIITARSDNFYEDAQKFCEEYLKKHNINYDKLLTHQTYKLEACKRENIDLMIDDAIDTCESLMDEGIKTVLFNSNLNKNKKTNVKRVDNWLELYDYIHNF